MNFANITNTAINAISCHPHQKPFLTIQTTLLIQTLLLFNAIDTNVLGREMSVKEFMREGDGGGKQSQGCPRQEDFGAAISAAALSLHNIQTPAMQDPVTLSSSDSMKEAMQKLFRARSDRGYIVDGKGRVKGIVTLRDILMQFSPPLADQPPMGGFFDSALQQTGAFMGPGSIVTVYQS